MNGNDYVKTIVIGRLGTYPTLSKKGNACKFILLNSFINRDGSEEIITHKCCAIGKTAKLCMDYLNKGDLCCIEGRLEKYRPENEGKEPEIIADKITFLSSKKKKTEPEPEECAAV